MFCFCNENAVIVRNCEKERDESNVFYPIQQHLLMMKVEAITTWYVFFSKMIGKPKTFTTFATLYGKQSKLQIMNYNPKDISLNEDSLLYIHEKKNGFISELENELGETRVRQLEAMGYIKNAPNPEGNTWMISERATRMAKSIYRESTKWEKMTDWFNRKVRRIDFSY